jgi:small subunit ribosomal protein S5
MEEKEELKDEEKKEEQAAVSEAQEGALEVKESQEELTKQGDSVPEVSQEEGAEEEDELTGIEEATEQEIVQKVTKKETRKKRKKRGERGAQEKGKEGPEWIEKVVQIRRVTKVVKGGKKLSFRAVVIVGNARGQVGVGVGKALEVISAIQKGVVEAKKNLVNVPLISSTIPHQVIGRAGAAKVILKPAREGTGIIAGGASRTVLELGGVGDVLSKSLGSRSPLNVARATLDGIKQLRKFEDVAKLRGITLKDMLLPKKEKVGASA